MNPSAEEGLPDPVEATVKGKLCQQIPVSIGVWSQQVGAPKHIPADDTVDGIVDPVTMHQIEPSLTRVGGPEAGEELTFREACSQFVDLVNATEAQYDSGILVEHRDTLRQVVWCTEIVVGSPREILPDGELYDAVVVGKATDVPFQTGIANPSVARRVGEADLRGRIG